MSLLAERIQSRLVELKMSARKASLKAGLGADGIRNIERGLSSSPRGKTIQALAYALECSVAYLMGESDDPGAASPPPSSAEIYLPVRYEVAAGPWLAVSDIEVDEPEMRPAIRFPEYERFPQWLERVRGDSYNRMIPDGSLVHVVDTQAMGYAPRHGDTVVVVRSRGQGALLERTLKQVELTPTGPLLWPRSYNPRWKEPLSFTEGAEGADDITVQIVGKVLRAYIAFEDPG